MSIRRAAGLDCDMRIGVDGNVHRRKREKTGYRVFRKVHILEIELVFPCFRSGRDQVADLNA